MSYGVAVEKNGQFETFFFLSFVNELTFMTPLIKSSNGKHAGDTVHN